MSFEISPKSCCDGPSREGVGPVAMARAPLSVGSRAGAEAAIVPPCMPASLGRHRKRWPIGMTQALNAAPPFPIGNCQNGDTAYRVDREAGRQPPVGAIDESVGNGGEVGEQEQEPSHEGDGRRP